jgi:hypothetical protein
VLNVQRDSGGPSVVFEIAATAEALFDMVIGAKSSASVLATPVAQHEVSRKRNVLGHLTTVRSK